MWGRVARNLRLTTTYLVRQREGGSRRLRRSGILVPFVGRHRHVHPPHPLVQLLSLGLPGLAILATALANVHKTMAWDIVDFAFVCTCVALTVRASVARAPLAVRAVAVACSVAFPIFRAAVLAGWL